MSSQPFKINCDCYVSKVERLTLNQFHVVKGRFSSLQPNCNIYCNACSQKVASYAVGGNRGG
jgi:hypothetical protein